MRRVVWMLCLFAFLGLRTGEAIAQPKHAAIVVDANNGRVLHAEQADEPRFPASLTKVMTVYMALEAIERGQASFATRIRISAEAAAQPPTKLGLAVGDTIALGDAIKALIAKSANDVAVAVAEHFGGTEERFAGLMTQKARLFGMSSTTFRNASGLPDSGQVTTARDMVRLALRLQDDFPRHYHLFATRRFNYAGVTHRNHNNLLHRFHGTEGIKTGYTRASGFNLVAAVRRGGRHVVGVVLGGRTAARRDDAMQLLVSRALLGSSPYKTRRSAPVLVSAATPAHRPRADRVAAAEAAGAVEGSRGRPVMVQPRPSPAPPAVTAPVRSRVPEPVAAVRPETARGQAPVGAGGLRHPSALRAMDGPARWGAVPVAGGPARGAAPSTLQQQATNLARADAPVAPPMRLAAAPHSETGFEIQVGAYQTAAEADRALAAIRQNAGDLVGNGIARTIPVRRDARQVFRARFAGFDAKSASSTCTELRRRGIDCFVSRAE
jgi:D-alanyl-D-alanine carboxypeptidase